MVRIGIAGIGFMGMNAPVFTSLRSRFHKSFQSSNLRLAQ